MWCALDTLREDRVFWGLLCSEVVHLRRMLVVRVGVVGVGPGLLSDVAWYLSCTWFVLVVLVGFRCCGQSDGLVLFDWWRFSPFCSFGVFHSRDWDSARGVDFLSL